MIYRRQGFFSLVLVTFLFFYPGCRDKGEVQKAGEPQAMAVGVTKAQKGKLPIVLEYIGDIKAVQEVLIYPKVAGRTIEKILVEKGDRVKEGQVLVVLEKDYVIAQLKQAEAGLATAQARLKEVEANLELISKDKERFERLYREGAISRQRYEQVDAQHSALLASKELARGQVENSKAQLELLEVLLKDHTIYAPTSGHVSARFVDEGTLTDTKVPILRISKEDTVKVVAHVPDKDLSNLKVGQGVEVTVDVLPKKVYTGTVSVINPSIDPSTRTFLVEIQVPNPEHELRSGMFARLRINLGERECVVIPREALNKVPGTANYWVYVVEGNRAVMKNVEVGLITETQAEILSGILEGEDVVIKGQNRLKDGVLVEIRG